MAPKRKTNMEGNWKSTWSDEERRLLRELETWSVAPTVWASRSAMQNMGIEHDVSRLLHDMGLGDLSSSNHPTYIEPTLHFFATLDVNWDYVSNIGDIEVTFRLYGDMFRTSVKEISAALGIPRGDKDKYKAVRHIGDFWETIADGEWKSDNAKQLSIRNPAIRYTARLLSTSFFARKDRRKITTTELTMLYRGLREALELANPDEGEPSNACVFLRNLLNIRKRMVKQSQNTLCFGGMLTPIFKKLKIDLNQFTRLTEERTLDLQYCRDSGFCPKGGWEGPYLHVFLVNEEKLCCAIPKGGFTGLSSERSIRFLIPRNICFHPPEEKNLRNIGRHRGGESPEDEQQQELDEEYDIPPLSPQTNVKKKKWYNFHKFNGNKIKELIKGWGTTRNEVDKLREDVNMIQAKLDSMHFSGTIPRETAPDPPAPRRRRNSVDRPPVYYQRRRHDQARHSVDGGEDQDARRRRTGKGIATYEERRKDTDLMDEDEIDLASLNAFDAPGKFHGTSSHQRQ